MKPEQKIICIDAVRQYGEESQKHMVVEECAKLINTLMKERRGRVGPIDIITEIADVMIMCEQLAYIYGLEKVEAEIERKLQRLNSRMNNK